MQNEGEKGEKFDQICNLRILKYNTNLIIIVHSRFLIEHVMNLNYVLEHLAAYVKVGQSIRYNCRF